MFVNHADTYMIRQKSVILILVIEPGTAFEDIPEDWVCPVCGVVKVCLLKNKPAVIFERQTCLQATGDLLPGLKAFFSYW